MSGQKHDARHSWTTGVTVGKFNPPHLGHLHLIETGAARVDRLWVLLCDRSDQTLSATDRAAWLRDATPQNVEILITPDDLPEAPVPWAERVSSLLPQPPEVAFTSEPWGADWAAAMGAEHVSVDQSRAAFPVAASDLRSDLAQGFRWLVPAARAALTRRVIVAGAESTGKTTLAAALAERLATVWVPEHGRWYWEGRRYLEEQSWSGDELRRIAAAQGRFEDDLARRADHGVLIADTDALVTSVWRRRYLGDQDPELEALALDRRPDLYLICAPDFEWIQDGSRESREHRESMHRITLELVEASGAEFAVLSGQPEDRQERALALIADLARFPLLQ